MTDSQQTERGQPERLQGCHRVGRPIARRDGELESARDAGPGVPVTCAAGASRLTADGQGCGVHACEDDCCSS